MSLFVIFLNSNFSIDIKNWFVRIFLVFFYAELSCFLHLPRDGCKMLRALLIVCLVYGSLPSVSFSYVINFERYQKESVECGVREEIGGPVKASDESRDWPWLVALLDADAKYFCSATLISSTKVITCKKNVLAQLKCHFKIQI